MVFFCLFVCFFLVCFVWGMLSLRGDFLSFLSLCFFSAFVRQERQAVKSSEARGSEPRPSPACPPFLWLLSHRSKRSRVTASQILVAGEGEQGRARGFWHLESKKKAKKEAPSLEPRQTFFAGIHGKNVWLGQDHIKTLAQRLRVT